MRVLLLSVICLFAFSFGCTPTEQGNTTQQFLDSCEKLGIHSEMEESDNVCHIEIGPQTKLMQIPKSGSIALDIGVEDMSVLAQTVRDLCRLRKVSSLRLKKCRISPAAIEEIKRIQLHDLSVSSSTYLDEPSPKVHGERSSIYELQIENCDAKLADSVLERIGFMPRTLIEMPSKAAETLTVVTDGRLAEFLDKKLGNQIQVR